jgi:type IV pilus assembly protein PilW
MKFKETGFSLVELLIALLLGLILIGGVLQVFLASRVTALANDELAKIQDNGRVAVSILVQDIRLAGYRNPDNGGSPDFFLMDALCGDANPCTFNAATGSDRIAVSFDLAPDDGSEVDCTGTAVGAVDLVSHVYFVEEVNGISSLMCRGYNQTLGAFTNQAFALVDGIDAIHFAYGLSDGSGGISRYVNASQLADPGEVVAVRVDLLVSSGLSSGALDLETRSYQLSDSAVLEFSDTLSRRIFTVTAMINNSRLDL